MGNQDPKTDPKTDPKPAGDGDDPKTDPKGGGDEGNDPKTDPEDKGGEPAGADDDGGLVDKHGNPAIAKGKYDRDLKAANDKIAELQGRIDEAAESKERAEGLKEELEQARAEFADKELTYRLELAGIRDANAVKAAKAMVDDFGGDVDKLREGCPWLFVDTTKRSGSTGFDGSGSSDNGLDAKLDRIFGVGGE